MVSPSLVERTGIAGQDYIHGYQELPRVPWIEGDVSLDPALSMDAVETTVNSTVTAELANGNVYTLQEAFCVSRLELNTREGQVRIRWEGTGCQELQG